VSPLSKPDGRDIRIAELKNLFDQRIVIIDGAMGTMIQRRELGEEDFRGESLRDHHIDLQGNNELLVLTRPDVIEDIHLQYLEAGADIIETNSFGATSIAQAEYSLGHLARELNLEATAIAIRAVEKHYERSGRKAWVAGSVGPTTVTLSASTDADDASKRTSSWDEVYESYLEQVTALVEGGCDIILIETIFDVLNAKAAIKATLDTFDATGIELPIMLSVTFIQAGGHRTVFGQSVEAFWETVRHANPLSVGLNCGLGASDLRSKLAVLSEIVDCHVHIYPNAGLPDPLAPTGFRETPEITAAVVARLAEDGLVNMVGGCCGTTPKHINSIVEKIQGVEPRSLIEVPRHPSYAGLERFQILPSTNFVMVGERANITGSSRFRRLIKEDDLEAAVEVARDQVRNGANLLDINMDEGLIDGEAVMTRFLNIISTEPDICRLPLMIDSSRWSILEAGLKCIQGKPIVNSISLKEGEAEFIRQASLIKRYGAAVIVMGFDEKGQAETTERKVAIAQRAQSILVEKVGFHPTDIIHDPNILAIGTGIEEHSPFAVNFIEATKEIRDSCDGSMVSGGVSNLSFSFRGNDVIRQAIHAVFLHHAIDAGLSMGIVNPAHLTIYENVDPDLRTICESLVLNTDPLAGEKILELVAKIDGDLTTESSRDAWRSSSLEDRLGHAIINGITDWVESDVGEALEVFTEPLDIIEGPLMDGMAVVGERFGSGRMFLPQVVKSARVMKRAVAILEPHMDSNQKISGGRGNIVLATVKGDVHDIGKNIVGIVLQCNDYQVHDLGVMVPRADILSKAEEVGADAIGLSGLITPSLDEMGKIAEEMTRMDMQIPLLIGGATTSKKHTAIKIAPEYHDMVIHVRDASLVSGVMNSILDPQRKLDFSSSLKSEQQKIREIYSKKSSKGVLELSKARSKKPILLYDEDTNPTPDELGVSEEVITIREVVEFIDWTFFFVAWGLKGTYPAILEHPERGEAARELHDDGLSMLNRIISEDSLRIKALRGFWPAHSSSDDIIVFDESRTAEIGRFHFLRQQQEGLKENLCLADYISPEGHSHQDHIGAFAVSVQGVDVLCSLFEDEGDDYSAILVKALADRLAEASAELLHKRIRSALRFDDTSITIESIHAGEYRSIRPAFGYPACPDHSEKRLLFTILNAEKHGFHLTESCATSPASSVSGLYFTHPEARYFSIGTIDEGQLNDIAARKGWSREEMAKWLAPVLR